MKHLRLAACGAMIMAALTQGAMAQNSTSQPSTPPDRVPMEYYIGDDTFRSVDISPSGRYVAFVHVEAVGDVLSLLDLQTQHVARISVARADQQMKIESIDFKSDDRIVFELSQRVHVVANRDSIRVQTSDDSYVWVSRIYSSNIDGTDLKALYDPSAQQGLPRWVSARFASSLPNDPNDVMIVVPASGGVALWRVNVRTAQHTVVEQGDFNTIGWTVDSQGSPVLRTQSTANGRGYLWQRRGPGQRDWADIVRFVGADGVNSAPTFRAVGAATQPGQVFVLARRDGENTSGLYIYDTSNGQYVQTVGSNANYDMAAPIYDLRHHRILASCYLAERITCDPVDEAFGRRWNAVRRALGDNVNITVSGIGGQDGSRMLLSTSGPQDLGTYYLFDGSAHSLNALFAARGDIPSSYLPTESVIHYTASDGQQLWGYLWTPPGVSNAHNLPLIVVPHGGPEIRDLWGVDAFAPYLASQGYAVFQPNFRGGGGFGRRFVEAGFRQWGQRMQDDVNDGLRHLVQQGIVDANRVCIMGWSYGGYVALTASFQNADLYKCAVAGAGVSDLPAFLRWIRDGDTRLHAAGGGGGSGSQGMLFRYSTEMIGNLGADDALLVAHSAAQHADRVTVPLLLIHGDRDTLVPYAQSQIMQRAMERAGHPVRLITLHGSDHTPWEVDQWRTLLTESVGFIQQHIGPGVPRSAH